MLFFIAGLVAGIKVWKVLKSVEDSNISSIFLRFGYATILYGIFAILASLLGIMGSTYPEGTSIIFMSALLVTLASAYITVASYLSNLSVHNRWSYLLKYSPHLATLLLVLFILIALASGNYLKFFEYGPIERIGYTMGLLLAHAIIMLPIAVVGKAGEYIISYWASKT